MFQFYADKNRLDVHLRESVTSGSVNVCEARFSFSPEWDGLTRTAVFKAGKEARSVVLGRDGQCTVPWEVLAVPNLRLMAGVYGSRDGDVVLPTVWADMGTILEGVVPGKDARPPITDLVEQKLAGKGDALRYTESGELGLYSGDRLLSSVPAGGGAEGLDGYWTKDGLSAMTAGELKTMLV